MHIRFYNTIIPAGSDTLNPDPYKLPMDKPTIFLAGPTDRKAHHTKWRKEFVKAFLFTDTLDAAKNATFIIPEFYEPEISQKEYGFSDRIQFFPEYEPVNLSALNKTFPKDRIYSWERMCLRDCDIIVFWVDRNIATGQYALTTNIEFGNFYSADRKWVVCGSPKDADKIDYMRYVWEKELDKKWLYSYGEVADAVLYWIFTGLLGE